MNLSTLNRHLKGSGLAAELGEKKVYSNNSSRTNYVCVYMVRSPDSEELIAEASNINSLLDELAKAMGTRWMLQQGLS